MNRYVEKVRAEWRKTGRRGNVEGASGVEENGQGGMLRMRTGANGTGMVWAGWRKETA